MTFKDNLGLLARTMFALIGVFLLVVVVATAYHDWPLVETHKSSLFGFILTGLVALPLAVLIIVWALIGQTKEWRIGHDHIRVRLMSLTAWQREVKLRPGDIEEIAVESFAYDDGRGRTAHWITVTAADGRRYKSPRVYDAMVLEVMRDRITILKGEGKPQDFS